MDEILGKNGLGFESHIDSVRVSSPSADYGYEYKTYFYWKLGPWSGSFEYKPNYDYEVYYGKYKLNIEHKTTQNELNSGTFNSFEKDVTVEYIDKVLTGGDNPTGTEDYDGRNFYVEKESGEWYLYICAPQSRENCTKPLALTAEGGDVYFYILGNNGYVQNIVPPFSSNKAWYEYKLNSDVWKDYTIDNVPDGVFHLNDGDKISLRSTQYRPIFANDVYASFKQDTNHTSTGTLSASGSISSMGYKGSDNSDSVHKYEYTKLFASFQLLTKAPKVVCGDIAYEGQFEATFFECHNLLVAPKELPATTLDASCYWQMFSECTSLRETPLICAKNVVAGSCGEMFIDCTNLKVVKCDAVESDDQFDDCFTDWLDGVAQDGTFYGNEEAFKNSKWMFESDSGVPVGWKVRDLHHTHATCIVHFNVDIAADDIHYGNFCAKNSAGIKFTPSKYCDLSGGGDFDVEFVGFDNSNLADENGIQINELNVFTWSHMSNLYNTTVTSGAIPPESDKSGIMITHGQDSPSNGRGSILDKSTLSNMENSFDENGTHPMNSYNEDGSYNQEIWGYKCFNSPVKFNNGIYGDDLTIANSGIYATNTNIKDSLYKEHELTAVTEIKNDSQYNHLSGQDIYSKVEMSTTDYCDDISTSARIIAQSGTNIFYNNVSTEAGILLSVSGTDNSNASIQMSAQSNVTGSTCIIKADSIKLDGALNIAIPNASTIKPPIGGCTFIRAINLSDNTVTLSMNQTLRYRSDTANWEYSHFGSPYSIDSTKLVTCTISGNNNISLAGEDGDTYIILANADYEEVTIAMRIK
jgi:hypothetical protein